MNNETTIRISALDNTRRAFDSVKNNLNGLKQRVFSVQGAIAGIIGGTVFKSIVDANRSFQSLQASLITFTGSAEEAAKSFAVLQQFAKTTPFELEEIVGGFNKLVARGMNPTIESFEAFGNIAAGTGKTLDQFIEAIADAVTGEFERLKEFGIKTAKEGEIVKFTFGGMTTAVQNSATAIEGYLRQLGQTKFAGAMELQANTLNGAISNLSDAFFQLATAIGKSGLNDALMGIVKLLTEATQKLTLMFGSMDEKKLAKVNEELAKIEKFLKMGSLQRKLFTFLSEDELKAEQSKLMAIKKSLEETTKASASLFSGPKPSQVTAAKKPLAELVTFSEATAKKIRDIDYRFAIAEPTEIISFFDVVQKRIDQFDYDNIDKGRTALEEYALAAQNLSVSLDTYAANSIKGLEDTLTGLIMGTVKTKDAFKSMATSIIADLTRILIQRSITGPLAELLFSALPGFGGGSGAPAPISNATFTPTGRAIGGPVQSGSPYMVGERGAELFVPNTSGTIVPSNKLGSGGVTINQTLNIDASADRAGIQRALELNRRQTISEINDLMRRNSPALARM